MKAVVMAGGFGTRLRPLTFTRPKPMIPLVNKPILRHAVDLLCSHGFKDLVFTVCYGKEVVSQYFEGDSYAHIEYSVEDKPMGTAGGVGKLRRQLKEAFLVFSGDLITDVDLTSLVKTHKEKGGIATMVLTPVTDPRRYGIASLTGEGRISRFLEKPRADEVFSNLINAGIYVFEPEVFNYIPEGKAVDFSKDVIPAILKDGGEVYGFMHNGYWNDVGNLETYLLVTKEAMDRKVSLSIPGRYMGSRIWMAEEVEIPRSSKVVGPAVIGSNVKVGGNVELRNYVVIGDNVELGNDVKVENSIIFDRVTVGSGAKLRNVIVGSSCVIGRNAILEHCALGDEANVGDEAQVRPSIIRIAPYLNIASKSLIYTDTMSP